MTCGGTEFLTKYCGDCHNATDWAGGVAFDTLPQENMAWPCCHGEEAVKTCAADSCHPLVKHNRRRRPSMRRWPGSRAALMGSGTAAAPRQRGHAPANRTEYQNEIVGLLDLDIDVALLPKDTKADGFDNVALALRALTVLPRR